MARTMSNACRIQLERELSTGGVAKLIARINSSHTALDGPTLSAIALLLDGVGEAADFDSDCNSNTAVATMRAKTARYNRLTQRLGGADNAEDLLACIADGAVT